MPFDQYGVVKVQAEPEVFWIVFVNSNATKGNPSMKTSGDFDEKGLRAELSEMGLADGKINELVAAARADWDRKKAKP